MSSSGTAMRRSQSRQSVNGSGHGLPNGCGHSAHPGEPCQSAVQDTNTIGLLAINKPVRSPRGYGVAARDLLTR